MTDQHASDCAVNNAPATEPCDCGEDIEFGDGDIVKVTALRFAIDSIDLESRSFDTAAELANHLVAAAKVYEAYLRD